MEEVIKFDTSEGGDWEDFKWATPICMGIKGLLLAMSIMTIATVPLVGLAMVPFVGMGMLCCPDEIDLPGFEECTEICGECCCCDGDDCGECCEWCAEGIVELFEPCCTFNCKCIDCCDCCDDDQNFCYCWVALLGCVSALVPSLLFVASTIGILYAMVALFLFCLMLLSLSLCFSCMFLVIWSTAGGADPKAFLFENCVRFVWSVGFAYYANRDVPDCMRSDLRTGIFLVSTVIEVPSIWYRYKQIKAFKAEDDIVAT